MVLARVDNDLANLPTHEVARGLARDFPRAGFGVWQCSIDIMTRRDGQTLFAEVKNLSADTWAKKGTADIMAQLKRHNRGIEDIMYRSDESGPGTFRRKWRPYLCAGGSR